MLSLPEEYRNSLRVMAAEMNLKDPSRIVTAASLGRKIIMDFLKENTDLMKSNNKT